MNSQFGSVNRITPLTKDSNNISSGNCSTSINLCNFLDKSVFLTVTIHVRISLKHFETSDFFNFLELLRLKAIRELESCTLGTWVLCVGLNSCCKISSFKSRVIYPLI